MDNTQEDTANMEQLKRKIGKQLKTTLSKNIYDNRLSNIDEDADELLRQSAVWEEPLRTKLIQTNLLLILIALWFSALY